MCQLPEIGLWTTLNEYFTSSEQVYADVFARSRKEGYGIAAGKLQAALLASRAIVAVSNRLILAAVRYERSDDLLWVHLAEIYSYAEKYDFLGELVCLYPGLPGNTSVKKEFAGLMAWYSLGVGSLSPLHLHIAERLISQVNKILEAGVQADAEYQWAFNLMHPAPPLREAGESTIHPGVRFFGMSGLKNELNELLRALNTGVETQTINLSGHVYDADLVVDVAHKLIARCTSPQPTRRDMRRKLKLNLHVASGFHNWLENNDAASGRSNVDHAIWEVEDISATGFLIVGSPTLLDSIKIGGLIGCKPENTEHWGVAIVRRLSRDAQNNLQVGVETLSNRVIGISLKVADSSSAEETDHFVLYLNKPDDDKGESWLLMKPGIFLPSRSFNMQQEGKTYLLLSLGLIESGEDYDLARYRKMEQEISE